MAETKEGLHFAWFTGGRDKGCFYAISTDNGVSFSPQSAISELGSHPQLATISGDNVLFVWDESAQMGNDYNRRIGVQRRNQKGSLSEKQFITADSLTATYPVITCLDQDASLIANTIKRNKRNYVEYQILSN